MAQINGIGQEKHRISELARLDAERTRLGDRLNELEIAERALARFGGKADTIGGRKGERGRELRRRQVGSASPSRERVLVKAAS